MTVTTNVYVSRTFDCDRIELFDWLSNPAKIAQWFGPKNFRIGKVISDLTIGGSISIEMIPPNGHPFFVQGGYLEINSPESLQFSLRYVGLSSPPPDSVVEISLHKLNENRTKLYLVQKFKSIPSNMEKRTKAWNWMMERLNSLLIKIDKENPQSKN